MSNYSRVRKGGIEMKVILQNDVPKLGLKGEIKDVSDGYGRNYLIPRGLAVEASAGRIQEMEKKQEKKARRVEKERQEAVALAKSLEGKTFGIKATAGEGGRLFGSVTAADIAKLLQEEAGLRLDRKKIELPEPIKTLGTHDVELKLYPQVSVTISVDVDAKE